MATPARDEGVSEKGATDEQIYRSCAGDQRSRSIGGW